MAKTPEERKKAARERAEERKSRNARFPSAILGSNEIILRLDAGEDVFLIVNSANGKNWESGKCIILDDAWALADFIDALIHRYNALVQHTNEVVVACPLMEKLKDFPLPTIPS